MAVALRVPQLRALPTVHGLRRSPLNRSSRAGQTAPAPTAAVSGTSFADVTLRVHVCVRARALHVSLLVSGRTRVRITGLQLPRLVRVSVTQGVALRLAKLLERLAGWVGPDVPAPLE